MPETTETIQAPGSALVLEGLDPVPVAPRRLPLYWYWIGRGHTRSIRARSEDEARATILAQFPHARGQRLTLRRFNID